MRILTTGIDKIDPNKFNQCDSSDGFCLNKPFGCLWGSTLYVGQISGKPTSDWKQYTSNDHHGKDSNIGVSYQLRPDAKIISIDTPRDYLNLMERYKLYYEHTSNYVIDFSALSKDYDAFHLTEYAFKTMRMLLPGYYDDIDDDLMEVVKRKYRDFYSYDAESWILFNLDCINWDTIQYHTDL